MTDYVQADGRERMYPTSVAMTDRMTAELSALASARGVTRGWLIRLILRNWIDAQREDGDERAAG